MSQSYGRRYWASLVFLFPGQPAEKQQLMRQQRKSGKDGQKAPLCGQQVHGSECMYEKRQFRDGKLKRKSDDKGGDHQFVAQVMHPEYGGMDISHADSVKKLGHAKHSKGIRLGAR